MQFRHQTRRGISKRSYRPMLHTCWFCIALRCSFNTRFAQGTNRKRHSRDEKHHEESLFSFLINRKRENKRAALHVQTMPLSCTYWHIGLLTSSLLYASIYTHASASINIRQRHQPAVTSPSLSSGFMLSQLPLAELRQRSIALARFSAAILRKLDNVPFDARLPVARSLIAVAPAHVT